jgi:hypothetical protein
MQEDCASTAPGHSDSGEISDLRTFCILSQHIVKLTQLGSDSFN